jgi:hypothetical protein
MDNPNYGIIQEDVKRKTAYNTQYKTVGVQWFASICFSIQLFQRWIQSRSANPTVSYRQPLPTITSNYGERRTRNREEIKGI